MKSKFASLQTAVRQTIEESVGYRKLAAHVVGMDILNDDHKAQVKEATSPEDVFIVLADYWSFLDYEYLESIVKNLCDGCTKTKTKMEQYVDEIKKFCERRVSEVPPSPFRNDTDYQEKLYVKLDECDNISLKRVKNLKETIASILQRRPSELQLYSVQEGCIYVTFLISRSMGEELFEKKGLTKLQQEKFREAKVLLLKFKFFEANFMEGTHTSLGGTSVEQEPSINMEMESVSMEEFPRLKVKEKYKDIGKATTEVIHA